MKKRILWGLALAAVYLVRVDTGEDEERAGGKRPEDAMESPPGHVDSDMEFAVGMLSYRLQALEMFDAYQGEDTRLR
ncbi:hypothetical protein J0910_18320 [Nocardiopsis sp. CNT-189]|uniref:hypothetical protein n=1 Tax=Nocardiopsis oceanisediminis TaxID=2816862 RepID=UPI003B29DACF